MIKKFEGFQSMIVVSRDVYRAALRERMMYGFLLLAFLFVLMANVPFFVDDPHILQDQTPEMAAVQIGFVSVNIFTILIAIFVSMNTLQNYLSRERLFLLLSKPLKRWHILGGVTLGLFEMAFMNWFLLTCGIWLVIVSQTREAALYLWPGFAVTALMALVYVSLVIFFFLLIPNAMSGILSILIIIAGFGSPFAQQAFAAGEYSFFMKKALLFGLNLLPQINDLWGVSMQYLGLFDLKVKPAPILFHAVILICALGLINLKKFRRFCRF